jgi:uncharacterized protein YjiS (DUF1127 family)
MHYHKNFYASDGQLVSETAVSFQEIGVVDFFVGIYDNFQRRRSQRRAVAELSGLSDRVLKDIGLNRAAIHAVAVEASQNIAPGRGR